MKKFRTRAAKRCALPESNLHRWWWREEGERGRKAGPAAAKRAKARAERSAAPVRIYASAALLITVVGFTSMSACDQDDGPCFELELCCDALARTSSIVACVPLPFEDDECQEDLDQFAAFVDGQGVEAPEECPQN